jgi:cytochrome c-type biogenesis protein
MMELASLAFLAGILSISSPCCIPLIPGYLSYVSGLAVGELSGHRRRVLGAAGLFVAGFALIFTALGASVSLIGSFLRGVLPALVDIAGVFVILMGLSMLGVLRLPFLQREKRLDLRRIKSGPAGALPLGMAFAVGWTPCIGPVLATILTAAAATQTAASGAGLLFVYSLGMGLPFMLLALLYARGGRTAGFFKRNALAIERGGGVLLVTMGVLLITGQWTRMFVPILRLFSKTGWPPI